MTGGLDVDGIDARAGAHDEAEIGRTLDGLVRDLGGANHEDPHARKRTDETIFSEARLVVDIEGELPELG